jgi:hypothetical protein
MAMPFVEESAAASEDGEHLSGKADKEVIPGWRAGMVRKVRGWLRRGKSNLDYRV